VVATQYLYPLIQFSTRPVVLIFLPFAKSKPKLLKSGLVHTHKALGIIASSTANADSI